MLHGLRAVKRGSRLIRPTSCVLARRNASTLSALSRHDRKNTPPEGRGSMEAPFSGGHPQWTEEVLQSLEQKNVYDLRSPIKPRPFRNIKDLPTPSELGEFEREANPWGTTRKLRGYFDTMLAPNPIVPEAAETAPSLVGSVLKHDGTCKRFEMNRSEALNALDLNFVADIRKLIRHWDDSPGVLTFMAHTVSPSTMFCPGTDLRAILNAGKGSKYVRDYYHGLYNLAQVVQTVKKPMFAILDGPAFGSASLFLHSQFSTTTNSTNFALPDVLVGFFPDAGIVHKLARLGEMGRYIALTGRRLSSADLHKLELANFHIDSSAEVVGVQTSLGLLVDDSVYRTMSMLVNMPIEKPGNFETSTLDKVEHLVKRVFKKKTIQLMMAELLKIRHEPESQNGEGAQAWAVRTLKRMKKASPLSLVVTLEYLNLVSRERLTFEDVLTMDFRLSQRFAETEDYWEGIKVACEKNRSANWSFKSVDEVPMDLVYSFFRPFEDPRMELKPMASRPHDKVIDWVKYYKDFISELTIPAPLPRIFDEDMSLVLARLPVPTAALSEADKLLIPKFPDLRRNLQYWQHKTMQVDYAIRHRNEGANLPTLIKEFQEDVMSDCFTMLRAFVMKSTDMPVQILNAANDVVHSIQAIMLYASTTSTEQEWAIAAKDVLPIISTNLGFLNILITPQDIPAAFADEAKACGVEAFDRGLIQDVDYVSH